MRKLKKEETEKIKYPSYGMMFGKTHHRLLYIIKTANRDNSFTMLRTIGERVYNKIR